MSRYNRHHIPVPIDRYDDTDQILGQAPLSLFKGIVKNGVIIDIGLVDPDRIIEFQMGRPFLRIYIQKKTGCYL